jgi:hypothetical protein
MPLVYLTLAALAMVIMAGFTPWRKRCGEVCAVTAKDRETHGPERDRDD